MVSTTGFGWNSFNVRFIFATIIVFATYNPEGASYYHWISDALPQFSVLKAFIGVILLIAWMILIRATRGSLVSIGVILAAAFFRLATWVIIDVPVLSTDHARIISSIIEIMLARGLCIGLSCVPSLYVAIGYRVP